MADPAETTETSNTGPATGGVDASLPYEDAVEELESIIEQIESGDIGLEQSIRRYERGAALLRHCRAILETAEQRVTELDARRLPDPSSGDPDA